MSLYLNYFSRAVVYSYGAISPDNFTEVCTADVMFEFVLPDCIETDDIYIRVYAKILARLLIKELVKQAPLLADTFQKFGRWCKDNSSLISSLTHLWKMTLSYYHFTCLTC